VPLTQEGAGRVHLTSPRFEHIGFSVSHTFIGAVPVVAVVTCPERQLGIDIEDCHRSLNWRRIATRRLSKSEADYLISLPDADAKSEFLRLWTLKESLVKLWDDKLLRVLAQNSINIANLVPVLDGHDDIRLHSQKLDKYKLFLGLAITPGDEINVDIQYV
jgi:phosphopantetheine--protein transferase-like protein